MKNMKGFEQTIKTYMVMKVAYGSALHSDVNLVTYFKERKLM